MAVIPSALITVNEVLLHAPDLIDAPQAVLESHINAVTMKFERATRRRLKARNYKPSGAAAGEVNLKLNGNERFDHRTLYFPEWPLSDVSALVIRDSQLEDPITLTLPGDIIIEREAGRVTIHPDAATIWRWGRQNIEATFNAGYDATLDADDLAHLEQLALLQVLHDFRQEERGRSGVSSMSTEGQSVSYIVRHLLPDVEHGLKQHARAWAPA